ncbi:MAG: hypothetical protein Q4E24_07340 [bacterium]|nr:hypothetical protein [bacterium]
MSSWETPEQRQIRELREKITSVEKKRDSAEADNRALRKDIDKARKEAEKQNEKLQDKLRKSDEKLKEAQRDIAAQSERIRSLDVEIKEKERIQNEKMRQMHEAHTEEMNRMKKEFRAEQAELKGEIASTRAHMVEGFRRMERETDKKLADQKKQINQKISQVSNVLNKKIAAVDSKLDSLIDGIRAKEDGEKELAKYWTEQANRVLKEVQENYRPELFAPKEWAKLRDKIRMAEEDFASSRFNSAADGGRQAFYDALDVKELVVSAEVEWNFWFNVLKEREGQLDELVENGENRVYRLELDGEEIEDENGIDYWTRGQFRIVKQRVEAFKDEHLSGLEHASTKHLQDLVNKLVGLTEEVMQVENASHTNFAMAISRYQLAEKIGGLLGENYQMLDADGNYFLEENREEYHAVFQNPVTGDQAAVVITPVAGADGVDANHIELIIGNADNNPVTRERINAVIQRKLQEEGLIQGGFPCSGKYGDQTLEEVARVGNIRNVEDGVETARASREGVVMPAGAGEYERIHERRDLGKSAERGDRG